MAPMCQVDDCKIDFGDAADALPSYYRRHKVCEKHFHESSVNVAGQPQKFCQQCARFHPLSDFDGGKRSCIRSLQARRVRHKLKSGSGSTGNQSLALVAPSHEELGAPGAFVATACEAACEAQAGAPAFVALGAPVEPGANVAPTCEALGAPGEFSASACEALGASTARSGRLAGVAAVGAPVEPEAPATSVDHSEKDTVGNDLQLPTPGGPKHCPQAASLRLQDNSVLEIDLDHFLEELEPFDPEAYEFPDLKMEWP